MDVKICSCPGRDRRNEDKARMKLDLAPPNSSTGQPKGQKRSEHGGMTNGAPPKTKKFSEDTEGDGQTVYTLQCNSRPIYDTLRIIRDALQFYSQQHPNGRCHQDPGSTVEISGYLINEVAGEAPTPTYTAYRYDESRRKLFINMDMACPFRVHVKRKPPIGTTLRVTAVFSQPNDVMKPVKRCIKHMDPKDPTNQGGCTWSVIYLKFMCLNTCSGGDGMNRRPIKAVFTLEHGNLVWGRLSMDVKVCACPARDRRNEDKARTKLELVTGEADSSLLVTTTTTAPVDTTAPVPARPQKRGFTAVTNLVTAAPAKTRRTSNEDDDDNNASYQIQCSSQSVYCHLKVIGDALTLYNNFQRSSGNQDCTELPSFMQGGGRAMVEFLQNNASEPRGVTPTSSDHPGGSQGNQNGCLGTLPANNPSCLESTTAQLASIKVEAGTSHGSPGHPTLYSWLESIGLQHCHQTLLERGCTDTNSILKMSLKDILETKLTLTEKMRLFRAILLLFQPSLTTEEEDIFASQELASQESLRASQLSGSSSGSSTKSYRVTHLKITRHFKDGPC
ncbi:unnamed protein product [Ixodes hexagonus]